ncbi:hypothetical protein AMECASPLE_038646 [Ameca splendens]|uniref:Uncharacterized protein n=1 Tax=Ameca splendens TaxID=208324 RepID=A0ABV0ZT64_9TELE
MSACKSRLMSAMMWDSVSFLMFSFTDIKYHLILSILHFLTLNRRREPYSAFYCLNDSLTFPNCVSVCRNSVMFNNEMMADVHFVVGPPGGTQRVPGHKVGPQLQ